MSPNRAPAFSLVELVIVVVIIGVISAIAVPRISRAAMGADASAVREDLHALRSAIDLYAVEHRGVWAGADGFEATFIDQMTKKTDDAGNVGTTPGVHIYGPYLRRIPPIPVGPNIGAAGVIIDDGTPIPVVETNDTDGWCYNFQTGNIIANTDDLDHNAVGFDTY